MAAVSPPCHLRPDSQGSGVLSRSIIACDLSECSHHRHMSTEMQLPLDKFWVAAERWVHGVNRWHCHRQKGLCAIEHWRCGVQPTAHLVWS